MANNGSRRPIEFATVSLVVLTLAGCGKPPQIGSDEQAHKTVDALFTAITAHDPERLNQVESQLTTLQSAGRLPTGAMKELAKIIGRARLGKWESAAEQLYDFIRGQTIGPEPSPPAQQSPKKR